MKHLVLAAVSALTLCMAGPSFGQAYTPVPAGDAQYAACLTYSFTRYEGGAEASKIAGQTKAEAWCTCMWQETPEDFKGSLARFSETSAGAAMNKQCERYAGWN